ncbi:NUDIX hydrolase [Luteococcus peritonei]|uniref:NUDIX domain-containing protein n=1 Tax=Luteococcus peritonei TaxID=88874 RepID=A0ABW4RYU4_9ACTN
MADEFTVQGHRSGDVGSLSWEGAADAETLARAVSLAADDMILGQQVRRLEVAIPATDTMARRALHLAGFRREGVRRQAQQAADGNYVDVQLYARLATDPVYGPQGFSAVMETVLPKKRLIAHVVLRNEHNQVLLLQTTYKSDWELPGGVVEPDETPRLGAEREVFEELGLELELGSPALVDWMPPSLGWSDALEFIYDAGPTEAEALTGFLLEPREISQAHWVDREELDERVSPLSARRIRLVLDGFTGFTEDGIPLA